MSQKIAEIPSDVCDIFQPNPQKLQDLAAIAVDLEIWRYELKKLCTSADIWEKFDPRHHTILLRTYLPELPTDIYRMLKNYVKIFGISLSGWAETHHIRIFHHFCNHQSYKDVLKYFDDFVCDYNGTIHHDWTAKRMMQCQKFGVRERFCVACMYFFEDDIKEMWPLVSENEQSYNVKFSESPQLCYWIHYLRNTLDKIQDSRHDSVEEMMIHKCIRYRASVKYFWYRMSLENRTRMAISFCEFYDKEDFINYILPKLDDQQLTEVVTVVREKICSKLMHFLLRCGYYNEEYVLKVWMRLRNFTSKNDFINLVEKMLLTQGICMKMRYEEQERDPNSLVYLCCEIWNSVPNNFKQSTIRVILTNRELFKKRCSIIHDFQLYSNDFEFIFTIMQDASFNERSSFWHNCWHHLILEIRSEHLQRMMKICFVYEREITQFKEKVIAVNKKVHQFCVSLLLDSHFGKLNKFIDFLWSDTQAARNFKKQILLSAFFTGDCYVNRLIIRNPKCFHEFINDAYNNVDLSNDFKNQFMLSPSVQCCLSDYARSFYCLDEMMEFIDIFVLREETLLQIKMRMIDSLQKRLSMSSDEMSPHNSRLLDLSSRFLLWCLLSEEEVTKFKMSFALESS